MLVKNSLIGRAEKYSPLASDNKAAKNEEKNYRIFVFQKDNIKNKFIESSFSIAVLYIVSSLIFCMDFFENERRIFPME